ncbi:MAG: alpha/beta fold hydrolase [Acidobacteria bacterium]|nr:alpha/beta fold hydrolase [Acidobacteriota bacterium]
MGAGQEFYHPLASWLSERGYGVTTFDYRGMGKSRDQPLRKVHADVRGWAEWDCSAALSWVIERADGASIIWIGHSLGGQIIPFVVGHQHISQIITVASGSGYWRENALPLRRRVPFFWFFLVPVTLFLFGYFPGKRLKLIGDVPPNVMKQWRRWCLHPEYAMGAESAEVLYQQVNTPITSLSFTDDEFMSLENIQSLHACYCNAKRQMVRIQPQDLGIKRVGHFGFFRSSCGTSLWQQLLLPQLVKARSNVAS